MNFRQWCQEMWYNHCSEFEGWFHRRPEYDVKEYFARYKFWLKREYRRQHPVKQPEDYYYGA